MKAQSTSEGKLTCARVRLVLSHAFFGTLSLRLKLVPGNLPTMATDGARIVYNPGFVGHLTAAELEGTLAHEVLHCALGHQCRRGGRDPELWNRAADLAINPLLIASGFTLPAGALIDPAFDHLSAEEIYARLLQRTGAGAGQNQADQPRVTAGGTSGAGSGTRGTSSHATSSESPPGSAPEQTRGDGAEAETAGASRSRPGGFGEVWDATDEAGGPASPAEMRRQGHEWAIAAEQALRAAKSCGSEPAGMERPLAESRQSNQDWRAILRDFVAATAPSDYRWTPPNRRYIASGLYLPSVERRGVGEIVIAVDTSGSIGTLELEQLAAEISAIADEVKPEVIHVVYCDAAVQSV
jgi:predicted metal-dependent peptidase